MIYKYNKLVRDKIINEINSKEDKTAKYRILDEDDYIEELNKKLIEEANEFIEKNDIQELADVMEVIESIMKFKNIKWEQVKNAQEMKRNKKGGFKDKIYLEYVEEN